MGDSRTQRTSEAWEALLRAQVTLQRRLAADDVWDPISMREYDVLYTLSKCPSRRARLHELNREILLTQPSLSRMVERLAQAGLVDREPDPHDKRGTVVVLTDAGLEMQRHIGRRHAASIRRIVALSDDDLLALRSLCDKLRTSLD
ncbi:MarR family transcriptional regulator [Lentzea tibetensis]|uniref:MarR family transcriptional regulator n=1 Tax=Lentzea tibetensis TaxID=2591470 RepID=A0A563EY40_9PSEU|nr:MarR family transcriptional regulator [Lentzea tibetensis]TWP52054.1 MarR family transcriptional regulator [Lentzea tibetensis]